MSEPPIPNKRQAFSGEKPWATFILFVVLTVVGIALIWGVQAFSSASAWVAHTGAVRANIEAVALAIKEAESSQRGYFLINNQDMYRQVIQQEVLATRLADELAAMISQNPPQAARARQLSILVRVRVKSLDLVMSRYKSGGLVEAMDQIKINTSLGLSYRIAGLIDAMLANENGLLIQRQIRVNDLARLLEFLSILGMGLAIALAALTGSSYRRDARRATQDRLETQRINAELEANIKILDRNQVSSQALADFAGLLQGSNTLEEVFSVAGHYLPSILPGTSGTLYLSRSSGDHCEAMVDWGSAWPSRPVSISPQQCWGLRQGRSFLALDGELACPHRSGLDGSSTCLPMVVQGTQIGIMVVQHAHGWSSVSLASASAEQLALATSNLRLRESLRTQSLRDPLTGLANRRELDIHLPREIARSSRDQTPLCVAVIDIDHFKRFNDTYGHAAGDEVLRAVGSLLRREIRVEDLAARMGGEEFVLVLSNATMDSTLVLAERLLCAVAELEVSYRGEALGRITCSIGLAQCPLDSSDPETLLSLADEALYRAKNLGRNRIEVAHPPGNQLSPQ